MRLAMMVSIMGFLFASTALHAQPAAKVQFDPVRLDELEQRREVTGELLPTRRADVAAELGGLLIKLHVEVGDFVKAGQPIAGLDDTLAALEVVRREADVKARVAAVHEREAELEREERDLEIFLNMGTGATQSEIDNARTDVTAAKARLERAGAEHLIAEAELNIARQHVTDHVIVAPYDGQITRRQGELGQWLAVGEAVVELLALDQVDAIIDVPEQYIPSLASSDVRVGIRVRSLGETFRAPVSAVLASGNELSRTFPVRIRLQNPKGVLRPGMSIVGLVPTGERAAYLTIHKDAILRDGGGAYIYIDAGGRAQRTAVTVLFSDGERFAVDARGVQEGTKTVIEGNEYLFPGQPLMPLDAPAGNGGGRP